MSTPEIWNLTLLSERELANSRRRQEQRRHLLDAIAQSSGPPDAGRGLLQRAWHATIGGLQRRGSWSQLDHDAGEGCATAPNDAFLTYRPSDY
jgi:hypothetical protein